MSGSCGVSSNLHKASAARKREEDGRVATSQDTLQVAVLVVSTMWVVVPLVLPFFIDIWVCIIMDRYR